MRIAKSDMNEAMQSLARVRKPLFLRLADTVVNVDYIQCVRPMGDGKVAIDMGTRTWTWEPRDAGEREWLERVVGILRPGQMVEGGEEEVRSPKSEVRSPEAEDQLDRLSQSVTELALAIDPRCEHGPETAKIVAYEKELREDLRRLVGEIAAGRDVVKLGAELAGKMGWAWAKSEGQKDKGRKRREWEAAA